jgi:ParB family chromosome partitioning protein
METKVGKVKIDEIIIPKNRARELSPEKVNELKESIQETGLLQPIIINNQNVLIAGLHRLEACKALGWSEIDCVIKDLEELDAKLAEIDENLFRAELTVLERAELLKRRKEIYEAKYPETKKGQQGYKGRSVVKRSENDIMSFSEDTTQKMGISVQTIQREIQIAKNIGDDVKSIIKDTPVADSKKDLLTLARLKPEEQKLVAEKIKNENITNVEKAIAAVRKQELIDKAKAIDTSNLNIDKKIRVLYGDFEVVLSDIPDNSVDLILTDPPYPAEYLPLFEKLSLFASKKLKPSGLLISYAGQLHLPDEINLLSKYLKYRWTACLYHKGETRIINGVNVINKWKPILFFQKEPVTKFEKTFSDYFISESPEKSEHEWQQNISVVEHIIDIFTEPGQLVVDPFLGGGTTAVACQRLERQFIGAEIDETLYKLILQRLHDDKA